MSDDQGKKPEEVSGNSPETNKTEDTQQELESSYEYITDPHKEMPVSTPPHPENPGSSHGLEVLKGMGILVLLHFLLFIFPAAFFFIGVAQLIYLLPAVIIAFNRGRVGMGQGILIAGAITFLLNAACFGMLSGFL